MKVNFCVFNHPRRWILDQIWFVSRLFEERGFEYSLSKSLEPDALNILLESFVWTDIDVIRSFCDKWGKSVGIIMSEHVELENGRLAFNGTPLTDVEYIANKAERFFSLCSMIENTFAYFSLGELPRLNTFSSIIPTHKCYHLPYPSLSVERKPGAADLDVIFAGTMTDYRRNKIGELKRDYKVGLSNASDIVDGREKLYERGKVAVNIPQTPDWRWISPMRAIYGLRYGVPTIHLGTLDDTNFSRLVLGSPSLEEAVRNPAAAWEQQRNAYGKLVGSDENPAFPFGLFEAWAEIDYGVEKKLSGLTQKRTS